MRKMWNKAFNAPCGPVPHGAAFACGGAGKYVWIKRRECGIIAAKRPLYRLFHESRYAANDAIAGHAAQGDAGCAPDRRYVH